MRLTVDHTTRYTFAAPVAHGLQRLRLKPKATHGQRIVAWDMALTGATRQAEYEDQHTNATTLVSIDPGTQEVVIACSAVVETVGNAGVIGQHTGHMPLWCFLRQTPLTKPGPRLQALVRSLGLKPDPGNRLDMLHALSRAVADQVAYEPGTTDARTRAEDALAAGRGVCQDHAHIFIAAGRLLDIPTRYVSGYLKLEDRDEQEAGHGWAEAHVEGLGWVGFDVPNALCPDDHYVRVATGCDYADAAPVTGLTQGAGETTLSVAITVAESAQQQQGQQQDQTQGGGGQSQTLGGMTQQQNLD